MAFIKILISRGDAPIHTPFIFCNHSYKCTPTLKFSNAQTISIHLNNVQVTNIIWILLVMMN